ncbi:aminotransferase class III-fold pyridoxal phosphate-dependent enzyme [Natribaculum luteum]|uniref:Aminotransferase class III-fold pyridoxal phosphate-dependent enzyme n=1 Tax=Natribaculum luteum TaxID=1586232 RepID=A0ABD5P3J9_9EURY|nr:aminotransferase class III-fold pyridoxal phosphate-dependent enzyme [Natribaculum luteum]
MPDESIGQNEPSANIPHWYAPSKTSMTIPDGDGTRVVADDGTEYLDFVSQHYCVNASHGNEAIVDAMKEQLERIQYVSSAKRTPARARLSEDRELIRVRYAMFPCYSTSR